MITKQELASMIDHTNLKAAASKDEFVQLCKESTENGFAMVAINSYPVALCAELLRDTPVHVGAAISFPLGQCTIPVKVYETECAIKDGADEIDYVLNIARLKAGDVAYIEDEMQQIVKLCREHNVISKVIFENCYLTAQEITTAAEIAKRVKPDFIKTSTGFGTYGARLEDVKLMKLAVGDSVKIKAAGGVRDLDTALAMVEAGVERIGTSSGIAILNQYTERFGTGK